MQIEMQIEKQIDMHIDKQMQMRFERHIVVPSCMLCRELFLPPPILLITRRVVV